MLPLVSICIPVYNAEKYISETLNSALYQTYQNIEIIVVDDGSTDNTLKLLEKYKNQGVIVLKQSNSGACRARNVALKKAGGKYIQFLDADDLLSPEKIEAQVEVLEKYPGKIAACDTIYFNDGDDHHKLIKKSNSYFIYDTNSPIDFLINLYGGNGKGGMISSNAWLVPMKVIQQAGCWNESLIIDQDGEFFCRVILKSKGILYTKVGCDYYRKYKHAKSVSRQKSRKASEGKLKSLGLKINYLIHHSNDPLARRAIARLYMNFAVAHYPQYKDLADIALNKVKYFGGCSEVPVIGGKAIEWIKAKFGWKQARRIQQTVQQFKRVL